MNDFEYRESRLQDEQIKLEHDRHNAAVADCMKQFEYLWEKEAITGDTTPALINAFKEVALKWYLRGRFNN